jgi:hypothetical protein
MTYSKTMKVFVIRNSPLMGFGLVISVCLFRAPAMNTRAAYTLKAVAWGYYGAKAAPVLRVKSGDAVC